MSKRIASGPQRPRTRRRSFGVAAAAITVVLGVSACSSSGSGGTASSAGGSAGGSASGTDASGVATAKANIANLAKQPFTVKPLSKKPPAGKTVAFVNCTVGGCNPGKLDPVVKALGWIPREYSYDFAKGPQGFVAAVDSALAAKPDYLVVTQGFPETVDAKEIQQAKAEGIPYIDSSGANPVDGVTVNVIGGNAFIGTGKTLADETLALAGGPVEVASVLDPTLPAFVSAQKGFESEMSELSPHSKVNVLKASLSSPATTTVTETINFLRTHPKVKYLEYPGGQALYTGVRTALQSNGLDSKVTVLLGALTTQGDLTDIANGSVPAGVAFFRSYQYLLIDPLARMSVGDPVGSRTPPLPWINVITKANATLDALNPLNVQQAFNQAWHAGQ
jgi:ABC-type sugar transport system substrate-binding protein